MKMKKIKNLKPLECVADLRYRCSSCGIDHWISIKEARTQGFIIVCDCASLLKVKVIKDIKIVYHENVVAQPKHSSLATVVVIEKTDEKIIKQACSALNTYGFTAQESMAMALKHTEKEVFTDVKSLIEKILSNLENIT
jgi:hypothetical protein